MAPTTLTISGEICILKLKKEDNFLTQIFYILGSKWLPHFNYDEGFWGDFNVILPEDKLNEAISRITSKIEETNY